MRRSVKRAPADGYTLLVASIGVYATNPVLQKNLQYDPLKDFDLFMVAVRAPNVLVVQSERAGEEPGRVHRLSEEEPGQGDVRLVGRRFVGSPDRRAVLATAGTNGLHVPYKGGGPAINDLIAGHAQVVVPEHQCGAAHIKAGKLKALAVTGDKRSACCRMSRP